MLNMRDPAIRLREDGRPSVPFRAAHRTPLQVRPPRAQTGAILVMFAALLLVIISFIGLALDLSRIYNRRVELQNLADAVALAAASELNGTQAGVSNALDKAKSAAGKLRYAYNNTSIDWSEAAIEFSASPDGGWVPAATARNNAGDLAYVKVDTAQLNAAHGAVATLFMHVIDSSTATVQTRGEAIAGPSSINVTPFAICAMSLIEHDRRDNPGSPLPTPAPPNVELVEYGFRRGVSYNLLKLNPDGTTDGAHFMVNPLAPPGTNGSPADMSVATVGPFICDGTMSMRRVKGGQITVTSPFPIGDLFGHFNSRFGQYPPCNYYAAPPDANVKAYDREVAASIPWMVPIPAFQAAESTTTGGKLWTVADPLPAPALNSASSYGVLWSFAKAVPYAEYVPGSDEPSGGYLTFGTNDWQTLYDPGRPAAISYPPSPTAPTPYSATGGTHFERPPVAYRPGVRYRRVLNVPLLSCPVSGSRATVLAIGKFFMTKPATSDALYGEFGGLASERSLGTRVELLQ